jgi:nitrite reductase/ring-hydroxylating ferredoxin subunit/uncharacterized membrane protein
MEEESPMSRMDRFIAGQGWLEPLGDFMQAVVGGFYGALGAPGRSLRDILHGSRILGHPLHPPLTDLPLGAWIVAVVVDLLHLANASVPSAAGDLALLIGVIGGLAAAAAGYTDHHETYGHERRYATLHGFLMTLVLIVMTISLLLRWKGGASVHGLAVALGVIGLVTALFAGYLGGDLTFGIGTMVNHNAFTGGPEDFQEVGRSADIPDNGMLRAEAGGASVLLVRLGGNLHAIGATCSHAGGPLDEGSMNGDVITCPWHGSQFCVRDGAVCHGPATFAQPRFVVREEQGRVAVKLAETFH